jgi:hypothetical protein
MNFFAFVAVVGAVWIVILYFVVRVIVWAIRGR